MDFLGRADPLGLQGKEIGACGGVGPKPSADFLATSDPLGLQGKEIGA